MEAKCIYCGRGTSDGVELSTSDIIPDGLTNKTIKNKNVCEIDHNNKFSDEFESYVINQLEYLRNHLGIFNKQNQIPQYNAKYEIEGKEFNKRLTSKKNFYKGDIISTKDETGKILFGSVENLEKISGFDLRKLEEVSLQDINQKININLNLFHSLEMKRLAGKVGYEWFCRERGFNDKFQEYDNIINFVLGRSFDPNVVTVIMDVGLYNALNDQLEIGSHALSIYNDPDGYTYVIFMFFGLIIYKIRIVKCNLKENEWQWIPFYGIVYDGNVINPICMKMNVTTKLQSLEVEDAVKILKDQILNSISTLMSTQILTLRSLYPIVQGIKECLSKQTNDEIYNNLLGYKDRKIMSATYVMYKMGRKFNPNYVFVNFNQYLKKVLDSEETVIFKKDELYETLTKINDSGTLIITVEKGIKIFCHLYSEVISNKEVRIDFNKILLD